MKKLHATIAAVLTALILSAAPAQAVRPIPGYDYPDLCKNIEGTQTILSFVWGFWELKEKRNGSRFKARCQPGWRASVTKG